MMLLAFTFALRLLSINGPEAPLYPYGNQSDYFSNQTEDLLLLDNEFSHGGLWILDKELNIILKKKKSTTLDLAIDLDPKERVLLRNSIIILQNENLLIYLLQEDPPRQEITI